MKDNIADSILARANTRMNMVAGKLAKQYRGVKPFNSQPIKAEEQIYYLDHLGLEDMGYLIAKHGRENVNQFIYETEALRQRRTKNG